MPRPSPCVVRSTFKILPLFLLYTSSTCHGFDRTRLQSDIEANINKLRRSTQSRENVDMPERNGSSFQKDHSNAAPTATPSNNLSPDQLKDLLQRGIKRGFSAAEGVRQHAIISTRGGFESKLDSLDVLARSFCIVSGWFVSLQALTRTLSIYWDEVWKFATKRLSRDSIEALKSVQRLMQAFPEYGVESDIFSKYSPQEIIASIFALSRLQKATQMYERRSFELKNFEDVKLVQDLWRYSKFAAAAYGWTLDLATGGGIHRGDLQALLKMTGIHVKDIIRINLEARVSVPAYFLVRDHEKGAVVLSIRGTWSAQDLLTDLCCVPKYFSIGNNVHRAHEGIVDAACGIQAEVEQLIVDELKVYPDYSVNVVGHSLGGSIGAIVGQLLSASLPAPVSVYCYGPGCVSPPTTATTTEKVNIYSVLNEGDPFSCISLGHVADVTAALSALCEAPDLRTTILIRTDGPIQDLDDRDLEWCFETMNGMRQRMRGEKLYPPGTLLHLSRDQTSLMFKLQHVPAEFFDLLIIGPRMFDLTQHVPRLYESRLSSLLESMQSAEDAK